VNTFNGRETDPLLRFGFDGASNYEKDTRLGIALSALVPEDELHNPDQRLFQVIHLITELAWAEMHYEFRRVIEELNGSDYILASRLLNRIANMAEFPVHAVRVLLTSLPQFNLLEMRSNFPPNTTGLDSPGARNLRLVSVAVWRAFEAAVAREGLELEGIAEISARSAGKNPVLPSAGALAAVYEGLHAVDGKMMEWKQMHLRLVWSQLGGHPAVSSGADAQRAQDEARDLPTSLRGRPISDLEKIAERPLFPHLWSTFHNNYRRMTGSGCPLSGGMNT